MASVTEILKLCRLCLVNDQVNISIFEEQGDIRQIFLKITACLPIKVSREDNLPKKICDGCLYKLELLYQFWNTTANAEKQLLTWLNQAGIEADSKTTQEAVAIALQTQAQHSVKEEVIDPPENTPEETTGDLTTEAEGFLLQQQLPFEPAGAQLSESGFTESQEDGSLVDTSRLIADTSIVKKSPPVDKKVDKSKLDDTIEDTNLDTNVDDNEDNDDSNMDDGGGPSDDEESEEEYQPPPKRSRRQAAIKAAKLVAQERDDDEDEEDEDEQEEDEEEENEEDVDDPELGTAVPKTEEESGSEGEGANPEAPNFVSVGTGDMEGAEEEEDNVKPGPSGVGKIGTEAPTTRSSKKQASTPLCDSAYVPNDGTFEHVDVKLEKQEDEKAKNLKTQKHRSKNFAPDATTCAICDKTFRNTLCLKNHKRFHRTNHRCSTCNEVFTSIHILRRHRYLMHPSDKYACDLCGRVFSGTYELKRHRMSHDATRCFKCYSCEKTFKTEQSLHAHTDVHAGQFKFRCDICDKGFTTKQSVVKHNESIHLNITHKCEICGKAFAQVEYLRKHLEIHNPAYVLPSYGCATCGASFSTSSSLRRHQNVHVGSSFICEVCGKTLMSAATLTVHVRIHTGEKPYVCDICGKGFIRKEFLRMHVRVHTREKPYVCVVCSKGFSQKGSLNIHTKIHTGEKPHRCDICEKEFATKGLLKAHSRIHGTASAAIKTDMAYPSTS